MCLIAGVCTLTFCATEWVLSSVTNFTGILDIQAEENSFNDSNTKLPNIEDNSGTTKDGAADNRGGKTKSSDNTVFEEIRRRITVDQILEQIKKSLIYGEETRLDRRRKMAEANINYIAFKGMVQTNAIRKIQNTRTL